MTNQLSPAYDLRSTIYRVAIVHDWLYGGGAEQVVLELHRMYPDAPIYTSYCSDEWREKLDGTVVTGYLQHWPFSSLRKFLPVLRQRWFRQLDLSEFDLIISSSGNGEAKFVQTSAKRKMVHKSVNDTVKNDKSEANGPIHICYCHTPTHFYWRKYDEYLKNPSMRPKWLARLGLKLLVKPLRKRDYEAAQEVDYFIANSSHIQADIKTFYGRDSVVIHPPVDITRFQLPAHSPQLPRNGFITAGRLVPYKRVDIIIEACNQLKLPLKIIGSGPDEARLKSMAGPTIEFLGYVPNEAMPPLFQSAQAFIFAAEEDFGITPVEAMAAGTPVIAYKAGGALDYVTPGQTGEFFSPQNAESQVGTLKKFDNSRYQPETVRQQAINFSPEAFSAQMSKLITNLLQE